MRERNSDTRKKSSIQCLEVLVSKDFLTRNHSNMYWTLSVYSLENHPVTKNLQHSDVFHFMVYDWERTIKQLLEEHQIPYSIIQFFSPETVLCDEEKTVDAELDESYYSSR